MVSEFGLWASFLLPYYAVETQYRQFFVNLAVHRKMGGLASDFHTLRVVNGFSPK